MRYIHKFRTPIIVVVNGVAEYWYYTPYYNPRHLPVLRKD